MAGPQPKFGQALASNDKEVREKAVKALERYLRRAHDIDELELRKIWRALWPPCSACPGGYSIV